MSGWIKISRKFNNWQWKDSPKHVAVFIDLIINAQWEDSKYRGEVVPRGSLTTSIAAISKRTGVSIKSVRTILTHLESTNEVARSSNSKRSMITITNYDKYQLDGKVSGNQRANEGQLKRNKEIKNKNIYSSFDDAKSIIDYLNQKTGKNFRHAQTHLSLISKILKDYNPEDLTRVVDNKVKEWGGTEMDKYLRPSTLFRRSNFENYVCEQEQKPWFDKLIPKGDQLD